MELGVLLISFQSIILLIDLSSMSSKVLTKYFNFNILVVKRVFLFLIITLFATNLYANFRSNLIEVSYHSYQSFNIFKPTSLSINTLKFNNVYSFDHFIEHKNFNYKFYLTNLNDSNKINDWLNKNLFSLDKNQEKNIADLSFPQSNFLFSSPNLFTSSSNSPPPVFLDSAYVYPLDASLHDSLQLVGDRKSVV